MLKGMKKGEILNLTGEKYGKLTVVLLFERDSENEYIWECKCACGKRKNVKQQLLRAGKTKSCGCLLDECRRVVNKYPDRRKKLFNSLYSSIKKRHLKLTGNSNCIKIEPFSKIILQNCFYCGSEPSQREYDMRYAGKNKKPHIITNTVLIHNGIDRVDSDKGYCKKNIVPCCIKCNVSKMRLSIDDFKAHVIKIYNHWAYS